MITSLISLLILALVLWLIFFIVGKFIDGTPLQIVGIILGLVFLVKALAAFGVGIP
jgi:predicted membrane chloride channel (bestrophin family)